MSVGFIFMLRVFMFDIILVNLPRMRVGMNMCFLFVQMRMNVFERMTVSMHMLMRMAVNNISVAVDMFMEVLMFALMFMRMWMFAFHNDLLLYLFYILSYVVSSSGRQLCSGLLKAIHSPAGTGNISNSSLS
jgi:hypothetical protein